MGKLGAQKAKASVQLPQHGTVPSQVLMLRNVSQNQVKLPLPLLIFPIEKLNPFYFICSQETNQAVSLFNLLTSGSLEASLLELVWSKTLQSLMRRNLEGPFTCFELSLSSGGNTCW